MSNPLLDMQELPAFSRITSADIEPAINRLLSDNLEQVDSLLADDRSYSWDGLVAPLEDMEEKLSRSWSPVSHLNSVMNSEELRAAYNACLPRLSDYATAMGQNEKLYHAFEQIANGAEYETLNPAQKKVIDNALRDFRLSGVHLQAQAKERYRDIMQALSKLTTRFEENILDATHAWDCHIEDPHRLAGVPDTALALAAQQAQQKELDGWLFTLDFPSYFPVISYADDRELRREMYTAYVTRASDEGPNADKWDNGEIMEQILSLRHELAQLLGFDNYADRSLATKMAPDSDAVIGFLRELAQHALPRAQRELTDLREFARDEYGMDELEAWDITYYAEKLRQARYDLSQEQLKPWFPDQQVVNGMFAVVKRLYGLEIKQIEDVDTWHEDVGFYEIKDEQGQLRGQFYLDLYAREHKRGGAWMDECISRKRDHNGVQIPVAYLTCNFTPPVGDDPALLTHNEVETLFHEFGHGLHHMLTQVDYVSVSGISGVAWDAVELPSQFMENWCWEREALDLFARHYQTGETLPEELYQRMLAARNFQSAMQTVRQIEFALFDFRIHREYDPAKGGRVFEVLEQVRDEVAVIMPPTFNRFPHSFSHIFAGGYAAGYYSYKWAEVLSADAFSAFEETGIFDRETGKRFLNAILEQGGSREPMELFVEFRGREPTIDALLRHSGLAA